VCVCVNRVLKGIFELKRDEVIGGDKNLHNEGFRNLYTLLNNITTIK
jgi:hypothetical protein